MSLIDLGEGLLDSMRTAMSAHMVSIDRSGTVVGPFPASSPPIGHQLITETGLDISDQDRTFFFEAAHCGVLKQPRIGDVIIDHRDNSRWRILPLHNDHAWNWHGQLRTNYRVLTKQD